MKRINFNLDEYPGGPTWDRWFQRFPIQGIIKLIGNLGFFYLRHVLDNDPDALAKVLRVAPHLFSPRADENDLSKIRDFFKDANL